MSRTPTYLILALVVIQGMSSRALAQTGASATIDIDATSAGTRLEPVWAFFGYDESNYTTAPEGRELLRTLAASHTAPVHVRTHFLFNTGDGTPTLKWGSTNLYTEDASGNPVYGFALIDEIMDATLEAGAFPLFEFGFMPKALSTQPEPYENSNPYALDGGSFYPPKDYGKWAELVTAWAEHVKERQTDAETTWLWELWNEPDLGYWKGTFEEYARLYDYTEAALHAVFPSARLGGPAVARPSGDFLRDFLEHCARGTNAVSGEVGTRLDMVTFHAKGGTTLVDRQVRMDLGNQLRLHRAGFEAVAASAFAATPIVISEADPDGCAACPSTTARHLDYRNSPAYGAYEVAMMKRSIDLAADVGVELSGVLTWAFTFPDTPYFAGYRALATNGIHLPVLNAFKLLGKLRGERLPATSSAALSLDEVLENGVRERPDVDVLATRDGDRIQILVWHYHDDLVEADPLQVTLDVSLPTHFEVCARVTHRRVDANHGNAHTVWLAQGSPEAPTAAQLSELRVAMESLELEPEKAVGVEDGRVTLRFELPRFGVSLVTLAPSTEQECKSSSTEGARAQASGCSCQLPNRTSKSPQPGIMILLAVALILGRHDRRRLDRVVGSGSRPTTD